MYVQMFIASFYYTIFHNGRGVYRFFFVHCAFLAATLSTKLSTKHYTDLFHHNPRCRNLVMSSQGNTNRRYSILEYNLVHWTEVLVEFAFTVTVDKYPDFIGEIWMPAGP